MIRTTLLQVVFSQKSISLAVLDAGKYFWTSAGNILDMLGNKKSHIVDK